MTATPSHLRLGGVSPAAPGFEALRLECEAQGHRMLTRFADGWRDGSNRFDRPGERIFGAYDGQILIALCGRNRDPYDPDPHAGRVRHLYVAAQYRRLGIGRRLVETIIEGADEWFDYLNTNCPPEAAAFYERLGFVPFPAERITHRLALR